MVVPSPRRRALLVFADPLALDLRRRGWSARLAPLLDWKQRVQGAWSIHWFTRGPVPAAGPGIALHAQLGESFAERLENAVAELGQGGAEQIVIVGRDCPELQSADIAGSFARLEAGADLVLGPDQAGGCWLIGLPAARAGMLRGVRWGQGQDFAELSRRANALGTLAVLKQRWDLDSSGVLHRAARFLPEVAACLRAAAAFGATRREWIVARFDAARHAARTRLQLPPPVAA